MKLRIMLLAAAVNVLPLSSALAQEDTTTADLSYDDLTLEHIMANPDWIGPPVETAWWALDGTSVFYRVKQSDSPLRDVHRIRLDRHSDTVLDLNQRSLIDGADPQFDHYYHSATFIRDGDVFVREIGSGKLQQITRTIATESRPRFNDGADQVYYQRNNQWFAYDLVDTLEYPVTDLHFSKDPDADSEDELEQMQLRLFSTLREQQRHQQLQREHQRQRATEDATVPVAPWYLGEGWEPLGSEISPDGRWLLQVVQKAGADDGQAGKMPHYVTASGYVDIEDVRTRVGRKPTIPQQLWLLDLAQQEKHVIDYTALPGLNDQPLAFLTADADNGDGADQPRNLTVENIKWHADSAIAAVQLRAIDNKDRWLATVDVETSELTSRHRLHDKAWINWLFNEFGWMPDSETLWLLSEETGYSHFYLLPPDADQPQALTSGEFEVMQPVIDIEGERVYLLSNRAHPTEYDLYEVAVESAEMRRLTELRGVESFTLSPLSDQVLVRWSASYTPAQISLLDLESGELTQLTDTRSETYRAIEWQQPEFVGVPSQHDAGAPIWSKFYPPQTTAGSPAAANGKRPIVLFVHGAGYTQNTHHKFPYYFREQMFHNLLTQRGYLVLDMDFRASRGYGRDWRTAIYRQMGHPELEDLIDGVQWLVEEHNGDINRVGVYGGSYGGFMSLMAMFRAPEIFQAGAALRPVTDWAHYNHGYTSNILNTPQQDPEAYRKSSPIEYADQLQGHLLIAHGMLDDNVFYQDSVRLAQRLIELQKENWELASYPMERHSFTHADSWLDEYRRILRLFENTIGDNHHGNGNG